MKIGKLAMVTFAGLLRNKLIILFVAVFISVVLLMMTPIMSMKAMSTSQDQAQTLIMSLLSLIMAMVSGFGSLLVAWSAADAVAGEMKSGTILAVLARPVRRWEFLLAKFLGVQLLMAVYVVLMFGLTWLLTWIGGVQIRSTLWVFLVYPMVRYAIYGALAMLFATMMHPIFAFGIVLMTSVVCSMIGPGSSGRFPEWLQQGLYAILPSTGLLSESNFLTITHASLKQMSWLDHLTALSYGLDYALVLFLLAAWSFRGRSLSRD